MTFKLNNPIPADETRPKTVIKEKVVKKVVEKVVEVEKLVYQTQIKVMKIYVYKTKIITLPSNRISRVLNVILIICVVALLLA